MVPDLERQARKVGVRRKLFERRDLLGPTPTYRREYEACEETIELCPRDLAAYALRCGISPATRARIATACAEVVEAINSGVNSSVFSERKPSRS